VVETQVRDVLGRIRTAATLRWLALIGNEATASLRIGQPNWTSLVNIDRVSWSPSRVTALADLRREITAFQPDVIHARSYNATLLAQIGSLGRTPVIFDARSLMPLERVAYGRTSATSPRTWLWLMLEGWMVRTSAATVGVSPPMSEYFRHRAPHSLVETIPLAVGIERMAAARDQRDAFRRQLRLKSSELLVIYVGSLSLGDAGIDVLARVMWRIYRGKSNSRFLCLTRDDPEPLLSALAGVGGLPITVLAGRYEEMPGWLAAGDWGLVIRSPRNPGLLNDVVLTTKFPEYLASGLPVIVNQASTWLTRLVHEHRLGLIVDEEEVNPIALDQWTTEDRDRLRFYARSNYALEGVAALYLALYRKVLASNRELSGSAT